MASSSSPSFSEQGLSPPEHFYLMSWKTKNELGGRQFFNNLHTFRDYLASPVVSLCMHHRHGRFHVASMKTTSLSCPLPIFTNYILPKIFDTREYHFLQVNTICIPKQLPLKHVNSPLCQAMQATFKQNSHLVIHYYRVWRKTVALKAEASEIKFITCYFKSSLIQFGWFSTTAVCNVPVGITTSIVTNL